MYAEGSHRTAQRDRGIVDYALALYTWFSEIEFLERSIGTSSLALFPGCCIQHIHRLIRRCETL